MENRKSRTSTKVKARYNKKTYIVVSAAIPKEKAIAFKEKCIREGVPQAQVLKKAIEEFLKK